MIRDKQWAENQFRHQKNSLMIALAGVYLLKVSSDEIISKGSVLMRRDGLVFNPAQNDLIGCGAKYGFSFDQILNDRVNNPGDFEVTILESWKNARRNFIKEGYETVKKYAEDNACKKDLDKEPWHTLARFVRNAISHDMMVQIKGGDLAKLPTSWGGKVIDTAMNGKDLPSDFLDPAFTIELHSEFLRFVQTH